MVNKKMRNIIIIVAILVISLLIMRVVITNIPFVNNEGNDASIMQMDNVIYDGENYVFDGTVYNFRIQVQGRSNNAKCDSYYVILTNNENISFSEVDKAFWSSKMPNTKREFAIIGYGSCDY